MNFTELKTKKFPYTIAASVCCVLIAIIVYVYFFAYFTEGNEKKYVYIDDDDTMDSVFQKIDTVARRTAYIGFCTLARHSSFKKNIRTGRYEIKPGEMTFNVFRKIKNGRQTPLNLTIPSVRTKERLAGELAKRLMIDSLTIISRLNDEAVCRKYGYDTTSVICMFIPDTYEVFWDTPADKFFERMEKESHKFWSEERRHKAASLNLTPVNVMTLASIIDEETANNREKPMIAGMYYNRLQAGMPLQADPTIKFAKKDFEARRIYKNWLNINSPYNTYKNIGLPPGPIRIASVEGIDAVLNLVHHNYMYMCANEDFSGTHNFAVSYPEHLQNARKYTEALNKRGIK